MIFTLVFFSYNFLPPPAIAIFQTPTFSRSFTPIFIISSLCDNKRVGYNAANWRLYPNATAGENTTSIVDFLSNGFKLRVNSTDVNADAKTYIYIAFAEAPLVGSNNVPCTAR